METIINALEALKRINTGYELPVNQIEDTLARIPKAKVCTPIIGKFSSGKSALVNTLLGYSKKILREDITPETAVPTELIYGDEEDHVCICQKDGGSTEVTVGEYRRMELDAAAVKCVRLTLRASALEVIPDVMLVDMPGFESGYEVHNRAIDDYLPQSLAYLVTFPADDLIVRSSVGNVLKELCLNDMPICIVITKYDKRNDEYAQSLAKLKESLRRFIGDREVAFCETSSLEGDADQVEIFLQQIQDRSGELLTAKFRSGVLSALDVTESYLRTLLKNSELSESELGEEEEKLGKQIDTMTERFTKERGTFNQLVSECIWEIQSDVEHALEAEESILVAMIMNNQDISEQVNTIVRSAVTRSVSQRFVPKVEKYLRQVDKCLNSDTIGDVHVSCRFDAEDTGRKMIVSVVAAAVNGLLLGFPILGTILGVIIAKIRTEKKRAEQKEKVRMQLRSEVYPQIMSQISSKIEIAIMEQTKLVNNSIEKEIENQRSTLEKAMADLKSRMADEEEKKENLARDAKKDLDRIWTLRSQITAA